MSELATGVDIFEQANAYNVAGEYDKAEALYDQLLTQNNDNPGLLATLGTMYLMMKKPGMAMVLLHASLDKSKKKAPEVLTNLGLAYKFSGFPDKAVKYMRQAINDKSAMPESYATYSAMFVENGDPDEAIKICKQAINKDPELALAHWNMSLALLEKGEWETAWDEYDWGFAAKTRVDRLYEDIPVWDGSPNKTVWVYGEQGIGDEIMFASMLPDMMKTNTVILECHRRLVTLFENSFGVTCYGTREEAVIDWPKDHKIDARISIGSLGKFYRRSREAFNGMPYIKADPLLPRGDKLRVGISWTGGKKASRVQRRTIPLSWWKSILTNESNGVEFVSLQYTDSEDEINQVNDMGFHIKEYPQSKADDYAETARLVKSCDLVITCCTSVVHLAGSMGVPTWVMVPAAPAWRYQQKGPMPWYRSVRLYRQPSRDGDAWIPVVQRIGCDLEEFVKQSKKEAA
jgi:tetratricopeptide (TPR) repeat protein